MVVDALAARLGAARVRESADAWAAEAELGGAPALLVKPLTFMNRSGHVVESLVRSGVGRVDELVVVLDDWALELGRLRVRAQGSHGGHNGLRSILDALGTDEFPRLRCGIRKGELPEDLADYVLSPFPEEDVLVVQEMVGLAGEALACLVEEGVAAAMNRFNGPKR